MAKEDLTYEILELAIQREIESYYIYMALSQRVDDPEMQQVLQEFAAEELDHKAKLELEILKTGEIIPLEYNPDSPEYNDYFSTVDSLEMDYKDILLFAIEKESLSFRTYINLISLINDPHSKEILTAIAEEEVKHKLRFQNEYDMLTKED